MQKQRIVSPTSKRIMDAMRSGEWLRSQWIARAACNIGDGEWRPELGVQTQRWLRDLERQGLVERREVPEERGKFAGMRFDLSRDEWRLIVREPSREEQLAETLSNSVLAGELRAIRVAGPAPNWELHEALIREAARRLEDS